MLRGASDVVWMQRDPVQGSQSKHIAAHVQVRENPTEGEWQVRVVLIEDNCRTRALKGKIEIDRTAAVVIHQILHLRCDLQSKIPTRLGHGDDGEVVVSLCGDEEFGFIRQGGLTNRLRLQPRATQSQRPIQ
jgi:hypothetical protein